MIKWAFGTKGKCANLKSYLTFSKIMIIKLYPSRTIPVHVQNNLLDSYLPIVHKWKWPEVQYQTNVKGQKLGTVTLKFGAIVSDEVKKKNRGSLKDCTSHCSFDKAKASIERYQR